MLARSNRKTAAVLSGVTASLLLTASAASAAQDKPVVVYGQSEDVHSEHVSYADLNLAQRNGAKKLERRVAGAVRRVCFFENSQIGLQARGYYSCADGAWDGASPQIAQAVARAREIALTGHSSIAATAITINIAAR
jgi:UrcA family protein